MPMNNQHSLSLREKQRQQRAELILQAAAEILEEKGYRDTSIDDIALKVGISRGTIYTHFPGKQDIIIALIARDLMACLEAIGQIRQQALSVQEKLEQIFKLILNDMFLKHFYFFASIYNIAEKLLHISDDLPVSQLWQAMFSHIDELLAEGQNVGEFRTEIPVPVMAYAFRCLFTPRHLATFQLDDATDYYDLVTYLAHIYFVGILYRPAKAEHIEKMSFA